MVMPAYFFENNRKDELFKKLKESLKKLDKNKILKKSLSQKNSAKFTMYRHFLELKNIID